MFGPFIFWICTGERDETAAARSLIEEENMKKIHWRRKNMYIYLFIQLFIYLLINFINWFINLFFEGGRWSYIYLCVCVWGGGELTGLYVYCYLELGRGIENQGGVSRNQLHDSHIFVGDLRRCHEVDKPFHKAMTDMISIYRDTSSSRT